MLGVSKRDKCVVDDPAMVCRKYGEQGKRQGRDDRGNRGRSQTRDTRPRRLPPSAHRLVRRHPNFNWPSSIRVHQSIGQVSKNERFSHELCVFTATHGRFRCQLFCAPRAVTSRGSPAGAAARTLMRVASPPSGRASWPGQAAVTSDYPSAARAAAFCFCAAWRELKRASAPAPAITPAPAFQSSQRAAW